MQEIITITHKWDDLDGAAGVKTEADETVLLTLGDTRVTLDLTEAHAEELRALLAPYLAAGSPVVATPAAPARRTTTATSTGTNGNGNGNGNNINGPEHAELRAAIRAWADSQGRTGEYKVARADGAGMNLIYPVKLRNDYFAAMEAAAAAAAKPETATEPEAPEAPAATPAETPKATSSRRTAK